MHPVLLIALTPPSLLHSPPSALRASPPSHRTSIVRLADDSGPSSFSEAFASLAEAAKPKKPGEGGASRDENLPIRLGGTVRDNSLGSIRAAFKLDVLKDPRNWQAEEFGLLGAILFTFAAFYIGK